MQFGRKHFRGHQSLPPPSGFGGANFVDNPGGTPVTGTDSATDSGISTASRGPSNVKVTNSAQIDWNIAGQAGTGFAAATGSTGDLKLHLGGENGNGTLLNLIETNATHNKRRDPGVPEPGHQLYFDIAYAYEGNFLAQSPQTTQGGCTFDLAVNGFNGNVTIQLFANGNGTSSYTDIFGNFHQENWNGGGQAFSYALTVDATDAQVAGQVTTAFNFREPLYGAQGGSNDNGCFHETFISSSGMGMVFDMVQH